MYRATLPRQRHDQLREEFLCLTNQRMDLAPGSPAYEAKSTEIDQVLASVWLLGTIYQPGPDVTDESVGAPVGR
jgi:hypothetical protein